MDTVRNFSDVAEVGELSEPEHAAISSSGFFFPQNKNTYFGFKPKYNTNIWTTKQIQREMQIVSLPYSQLVLMPKVLRGNYIYKDKG